MEKKELEQKLNKLREKRNKLNTEAFAVQAEIDKMIIDSYDADKFEKCFVKLHGNETYIYVNKVKRMAKNCVFNGYGFSVVFDRFFSFDKDLEYYVPWDDLENVEIISEEEFNKLYFKVCEDIFNSREDRLEKK